MNPLSIHYMESVFQLTRSPNAKKTIIGLLWMDGCPQASLLPATSATVFCSSQGPVLLQNIEVTEYTAASFRLAYDSVEITGIDL